MLLYNLQDKLERYNAPDTLKCQHSFKLPGSLPILRYGSIFCSIIEDSLDGMTPWVAISAKEAREKYTVKTYGEARMTDAHGSTVLPSSWQNMGWEKGICGKSQSFQQVETDVDGNMRMCCATALLDPP